MGQVHHGSATITHAVRAAIQRSQTSLAQLSCSALHRCLQRHGISRLPDVEGDKPKRPKFKRLPKGLFHIDITEVQTAEGKLYLFVGIDRTGKFAVSQLVDKADRKTAWEFPQHMLEAVNSPMFRGRLLC